MATITTANAGAAAPATAPKAPRPKPKVSRSGNPGADRAESQRKQAGRASYTKPVNMPGGDPIVSATKKVLLGSGDKVNTEG